MLSIVPVWDRSVRAFSLEAYTNTSASGLVPWEQPSQAGQLRGPGPGWLDKLNVTLTVDIAELNQR
jgi:hypothetical protein